MGVEEELLLLDPATDRPTAVAPRALRAHRHRQASDDAAVAPELFRQQIETQTEPCLTVDELARQLCAGRRTVNGLAAAAGAAAVAVPAPVLADGDDDDVTRDDRYQRIREEFGELARTSLVCAMHVHVEIDDPEQGVRVLDRMRPWLPVLLAASANSPYSQGRDTGYASWRTQLWTRWPSTGTGEAFGSLDAYEQVRQALREWGVAFDDGMVYFDARLSARLPTLEVRVTDVCTDPDDAVLVAALTRALVSTFARDEGEEPSWRSDLLRAATWRASRYGLSGRLVHPVTRCLASTRDVLDALLTLVRPALEETGDRAVVEGLTEQLLARGGGATRQRRVLEKHGSLEAVVADLAQRTRRSGEDPLSPVSG